MHEDTAKRHDKIAEYWAEQGDERRASLERWNARIEREAAELERERARVEREAPRSGDH